MGPSSSQWRKNEREGDREKWDLAVSGPVYREPESHQSILTTMETVNKLQNQLFLDPWESKVTGQIPKLEKQDNKESHHSPEQKQKLQPREPGSEQEKRNCNWPTVIDRLLEARAHKSESYQVQGDPVTEGPSHSWGLTPGARPGSHRKFWRKIPSCFQQGEEERNHFEIHRCALFFLTKVYPPEKSLNRNPNGLGEGKHPTISSPL